jgi:nucleoside-diphosphate-sugar epimerase
LLSIPPGASGDPAFTVYADDIASSPTLEWIGYFSTIGVYGDAGGGWVDETTDPRPGSERGARRLEAEREWLRLGEESGKTVVILRLPGIYGPGRNTLKDLRSGKARRIVKPGHYFNRVHVEDIAAAVEAALHVQSSRIFNITDDLPAAPEDVIAFGAELLGMPCPPAIPHSEAILSPMARSFYSESKKVSNARMKAELGVVLKYPTYKEGLTALAGNTSDSF